MQKRRRFTAHPAVLALLAAAGQQALAACPGDESPGPLKASYQIEVYSDQPKLLLVHQRGQDLKLLVNDATQLRLNSPGGRNSVDFVLLETAAASEVKEICLYPVFADSPGGSWRFEELPVDAGNAGQLALLRQLNSAGAGWLAADTANATLATEHYETLARSRDVLPDSEDLRFALPLLAAYANQRLRRYEQALEQLALLETGTASSHLFQYQMLWQRGRSLLRSGRAAEGITALEQARELVGQPLMLQQPGLRYDLADINNLLGEAYVTTRQLELAATRLAEAAEQALPDNELLARIYNNLGYLSIQQAQVAGLDSSARNAILNRSTEEHLSAAWFAAAAQNREVLQVVENNLAVHYARIGERRKSLVHFLNVLRMMEEFESPETRAFLYSNLSHYSQILGDYGKAANYLGQSMALNPTLRTARFSNSHCRLGLLHRLLQEQVQAEAETALCLEQARAQDDLLSLTDGLLQASYNSLARGNADAAEQQVREALQQAAAAPAIDIDGRNLLQQLWTQLAAVLHQQGRQQEALAAVTEALAVTNSERDAQDLVAAMALALRIHDALGQWEAAAAIGEQALARIEDLHRALEAERLGPAWSNQTNAVYVALAAHYFNRYQAQDDVQYLHNAFATIERSRDISLRQRLAAGLPNESLALEEAKQLALFSRQSSLLASAGHAAATPETLYDYHHQHDLLALARLNAVETLPVPAAPSLATVQARLLPGQLAIEYLLAEDTLYVLAISADQLQLRTLPRDTELNRLLQQAESLLHTPASFDAATLQALAALLLPDFDRFAAATELLLVPHGPLDAFPFAALPVSTPGSYEPLIARFRLTTVPSLGTWLMDKALPPADYTANAVVLADPVFSPAELPGAASPEPLRSWTEGLAALPFTAAEARNIARHVAAPVHVFTGNAAARNTLTTPLARNARILHIATHGYFKSTSEDNIGLALSTIDANGNPDPGFITLTELFGYAFNNELVVISGCDTAMGKEQAGVGLNSLSRGFHAQGVKHVIATLWPVSDRASAEFMGLFYERLQAGKDVALALQQAQQALSRNPAWRNPYYWAGYTLTSVTPDSRIALP